MSRINVVLSILISLAIPKIAAAEVKIAYVDLQAAIVGVDDGKAARKRLQAWIDQSEDALKKEQDALRSESDTLAKQDPVLSPAAREAKTKALQQKTLVLQEKFSRLREEAQTRERKEMEPIVTKIDAVIAKIADKQGLDFVLDKRESGLVFARGKYEITAEVIREYNAKK